MKTYTITILNICICILITLLGGCSDDDIIHNDNGSTLQETQSHLISTFSLPEGKYTLPESIEQLFFQLKSLSNNSKQTFEGKLKKKGGIITCDMFIPKSINFEDGDYFLRMKPTEDGEIYPLSYQLTFRSKMVSEVQDIKYIYDLLSGEGTKDNPYLISSTADFANFATQLIMFDHNYGYGQYFKQTADIIAPITNCLYQGEAYKSAPFAGNYDGDNYTINKLKYSGTAEQPKDSIGLFSKLHDGAVIQNLVIESASISNPGNCCGLLAGVASGNIRINNVALNGSIISAKDNVGGLIGYVDGSQSSNTKLDISNITLNVTFSNSGSNFFGGLIGQADNADIKLDSIYCEDIFNKLAGNNCVGGLIGKLHGSIDVSRVYLQHTMETGFSIYGNEYVGGVIGEGNLSEASSFNDITIDMPIQGNKYVGGLIGKMQAETSKNILISITDFHLGNPSNNMAIRAEAYAGGIIGHSDATSANAFTIEFAGISSFNSEVTGKKEIGGVFGSLNDTDLSFKTGSQLRLDITKIEATEEKCGSLAGALYYKEQGQEIILNPIQVIINQNININSPSMIGGVVGYISKGKLSGTYAPEFSATNVIGSEIPQPIFHGNINIGKSYREIAKEVGGIVGYADKSSIRNFFTQPSIYGIENVGGIVGNALDTEISDCAVKTETFNNQNSSANHIGGIAGRVSCSQLCEFSNLINYSNISQCNDKIGGIFGYIYDSYYGIKINKVVNLGNISATYSVGGIVGMTDDTGVEIYNAANYGAIHGNLSSQSNIDYCGLGGIAGRTLNGILIYKSVNHGDVTANQDAKYAGVGGILGYEEAGGVVEIRYCCNRANINCPKEKENNHGIGGIVGNIKSTAENYVLDCYNMGEINGQKKATGTLGTDYRGGIVGNLGSHGRCYRAVNGGKVEYGNAGVGNGNKNNLTHIYVLYNTGKIFGAEYIPEPVKEDKNIYQGFDFTGSHDPDKQPVWVLGGKYSSENKMLPYLYSEKCYFQFAKYTP